jgi:hypothetical protein
MPGLKGVFFWQLAPITAIVGAESLTLSLSLSLGNDRPLEPSDTGQSVIGARPFVASP